MLGKHFLGYQVKRGKVKDQGLHEEKPDDYDMGWNLPYNNEQTGVESMYRQALTDDLGCYPLAYMS